MATQGDRNNTSTPVDSRRTAASQTPSQMVGPTRLSDDPPSPLVAAYETGRWLNQLDWHLQQAWLLPAIDVDEARLHARHVADILANLASKLRPALSAQAEISLRESLLARRDEWNLSFGSTGHMSVIQNKAD
ncbi:MAG: hypothetical protein ACYC3I_03935 [Gemmataceae bacterium]